MSADFLSRARAEALRRIEEKRYEAAVAAEMKRINEEEIAHAVWMAHQDKLYYTFHEERKVKLAEACKVGLISAKKAEIERAVSDFAIQNLSIEDLYEIVEKTDWCYIYKYMDTNGLSVRDFLELPKGRTGPGFPQKFQAYCVLAIGDKTKSAGERISNFNKVSLAAMD